AVGNPPWEVSQLGEEEFFASRAPAIAALKGQQRKNAIAELELRNPSLWNAYKFAKRVFDVSNQFARSAHRFRLTATGKINTYALFSELFESLAPRVGVIVPTGIAADATTAPFFAHLMSSKRVLS